MDMCRFSETGDPEYQKVAAAIKRALQNLSMKLQPDLVRLDGMESGNSAGPGTPVVPPQWSRTGDNHQVDYLTITREQERTPKAENKNMGLEVLYPRKATDARNNHVE